MNPLVTNCSQDQMRHIADLYRKGYSFIQISKVTRRAQHTVRRYHRLYERYGIGAFAEWPAEQRKNHVRGMK